MKKEYNQMVKKEISKIKKDGGRDGIYTENTSKSPERSGTSFSMAHHNSSTNSNSFIHKSNGGINSAYQSSTNNTGGAHHNHTNLTTAGSDYNGNSNKKRHNNISNMGNNVLSSNTSMDK